MKKFFWAICLFTLSAPAFSAPVEKKEFEAPSVKKLEVKNAKGSIEIRGVKSTKKISVSVEKIHFDPKCRFVTELSGDVLRIAVDQDGGLFDKVNCEAKISVEMPASIDRIETSTAVAPLRINDVDGQMEFKTASGDVEIKGDVLKGVSGKSASGNVSLSYKACPKRADIDLMTASGDSSIQLGSGCKIRVSYKSAAGDLFNELGDSEDYQVLVNVKSASGDLKVKKASK